MTKRKTGLGGTFVKPSFSRAMHTSRHGTPETSIEVAMPAGTHHRAMKATLHRVASVIELLSVTDGWVVQIDTSRESRGRVYLELVKGDAAELESAEATISNALLELWS